jgi:outer membrane protein assembly factor BamB
MYVSLRMQMRQRYWIPLILIMIIFTQTLCAANASANTDDWGMFHNDPSRCGYVDGEASNSAKLLWNFSTKDSVWSSPVVADGHLIFGSTDGHVYCLNVSNGQPLWHYPSISRADFSSPAIGGGRLFIGSSDGNLTCIDINNGERIWMTNLNGAVWGSPLYINGGVFVGSKDSNFYCVLASTGEILWKCPTAGAIGASPAYAEGIVYFSSNYNVYAVNTSNGKELWHAFSASGDNTPAIYNGCLYIGSGDGYILCLNAYTGAENWKYFTPNTVVSSPAAAYGCVYIGSEDNSIYCLNASSGEKIWQTYTGYWICSSPVVSGGNLYVGSQDCNIYCMDAFNGAIKWSYATGEAVNSSPSISNNTLFIGSDDRLVYAFALCNSTQNNPSPHSTQSLKPTTVAIDAISCFSFAMIVAALALFINFRKFNQKPADLGTLNLPWYRKHIDLLCVLAIVSFSSVLFVNLGNSILWAADEQTYEQWSYHMLRTGDYLTPWNFGVTSLWIGKPPMGMWLASIAFQIFGVNNFSARFWSVIFGISSLLLIYFLGKHLYNRTVGVLSALVLGTSVMFYTYATRLMTDVPLLFFILASIYFLILSHDTKNPKSYAAISGLFFGLGLMTKQTEALLIPLIALTYFVLSKKSVRVLFSKRFALFFGVALLVFSPWLIVMSVQFGWDFWNYYFLYSTYQRVISPIEGHVGGILYYFNYIAGTENIVWLLLLPFGFALSAYFALKRSKSDILLVTWIICVFAVFTIAQTKLPYYILPVYPAFALIISSLLYRVSSKIWSSKLVEKTKQEKQLSAE